MKLRPPHTSTGRYLVLAELAISISGMSPAFVLRHSGYSTPRTAPADSGATDRTKSHHSGFMEAINQDIKYDEDPISWSKITYLSIEVDSRPHDAWG